MKKSSESSFRNKTSNVVNIPGTKVSVENAQLLTSTGSSTLDFFLGGGLAIGTICMIEEDRYNSYASLLMKYFLAEGVTRKHSLFLAGGDKNPKDFLKELPAAKGVKTSPGTKCTFDEQKDPSKLARRLEAQSLEDEPPPACSFIKPNFVEIHDPMKMAMHLLAGSSVAELPAPGSDSCCSNPKPVFDEEHGAKEISKSFKALSSKFELPADLGYSYCTNVEPIIDVKPDPIGTERNFKAQVFGDLFPGAKSSKYNSDMKSNDLKIAWRYQSQNVEDTIKAESHNIGFDLTMTMPYEEIENCTVSTWIPTHCAPDEPDTDFLKKPYIHLLNKIKRDVESQKLKTSAKSAETVLRIGINSIGSPLWRTGDNKTDELHLLRFLYALKIYLRTSFAVAVITVPSCLLSNQTLVIHIRHVCDTVIALESFVGSDKMSNPLFKDFDGLLQIKKLPVLNTFTYPSMTKDLAFKLKKRGLIIERLHLPPEFGDPSPEQFGCSGHGKKLDF